MSINYRSLVKVSLVLLIAAQVGLAVFLGYKCLQPAEAPQPRHDNETKSLQPEPLSGPERMRSYALEHAIDIDVTEWQEPPEFYDHLQNRRTTYIRSLKFGKYADDRVMAHLRGLKVTDLAVLDSPITSAGLSDIAEMRSLEHLELAGVKLLPQNLKMLVKLSRLTWLRTTRCDLNDECLQTLGSAHNLDGLVLSGDKDITDAGLKFLTPLRLRTLGLLSNSISYRGVAIVSQMPTVDTLILAGNQISDKAFASLSRMSKLKSLTLSSTSITDKGLDGFKPPPSLQEFFADNCRGLTKAAVDRFRKRNQHCVVTSNAR